MSTARRRLCFDEDSSQEENPWLNDEDITFSSDSKEPTPVSSSDGSPVASSYDEEDEYFMPHSVFSSGFKNASSSTKKAASSSVESFSVTLASAEKSLTSFIGLFGPAGKINCKEENVCAELVQCADELIVSHDSKCPLQSPKKTTKHVLTTSLEILNSELSARLARLPMEIKLERENGLITRFVDEPSGYNHQRLRRVSVRLKSRLDKITDMNGFQTFLKDSGIICLAQTCSNLRKLPIVHIIVFFALSKKYPLVADLIFNALQNIHAREMDIYQAYDDLDRKLKENTLTRAALAPYLGLDEHDFTY